MLRLSIERERRHWSKAELARRARLDQSAISRIEASRLVPYPTQLTRIAEALGWDIGDAEALLERVAETAVT